MAPTRWRSVRGGLGFLFQSHGAKTLGPPREGVARVSESSAASGHEIVIRATGKPFLGDDWAWEVEVVIDGDEVGSGTAPTASGVLDVAMDVLYGDTNDHLNADYGALSRLSHA